MGLRTTRAAMLGLLILPVLATLTVAETPVDSGGRFTMSPVDGGFLRLDKQTGAVAMCARTGSDWACKPVDDQAKAISSDELSRLQTENKALRDRVKELEESLETQKPAPGGGPLAEGPPGGKVQLPTDEEVDQALDYLSRVYKKVRDHIKDLDKPISPDEAAPPPPPKGAL